MDKFWEKIINSASFAHMDIKDMIWIDEIDLCNAVELYKRYDLEKHSKIKFGKL